MKKRAWTRFQKCSTADSSADHKPRDFFFFLKWIFCYKNWAIYKLKIYRLKLIWKEGSGGRWLKMHVRMQSPEPRGLRCYFVRVFDCHWWGKGVISLKLPRPLREEGEVICATEGMLYLLKSTCLVNYSAHFLVWQLHYSLPALHSPLRNNHGCQNGKAFMARPFSLSLFWEKYES
jgi:hypothetical protein